MYGDDGPWGWGGDGSVNEVGLKKCILRKSQGTRSQRDKTLKLRRAGL